MDPSYALEVLLVIIGFASIYFQDKRKKEREAEAAKRAEERRLAEEAEKAKEEAGQQEDAAR